jgi:tetratricopeptide (TPR) repeat protein
MLRILRVARALAWVCLLAFSRLAWGHGDVHERIEALDREIANASSDAALYLQRGELHRVHEDWAKAHADLDQAVKLDPGLTAVWMARARLWMDQQRPREAEEAIDRFLQKEPRAALGLKLKAQALTAQKKHADAAPVWKMAIETSSSPDLECYLGHAEALAKGGKKYFEEALATLDEGIAKLGNVPALGLPAIELETQLGRFDAALARNERMTPRTGRIEEWIERRGDLLSKAGRRKESHAAYQEALASLEAKPRRASKATEALKARLLEKSKATAAKPAK